MAKKAKGINPDLESAVNTMLLEVRNNPDLSLTDKMKILDRALKQEALNHKAESDDWGAGLIYNDSEEQ